MFKREFNIKLLRLRSNTNTLSNLYQVYYQARLIWTSDPNSKLISLDKIWLYWSSLYQAYYQTHKRVQIQLVLYQVLTFVSLFIYNVSMDGQRCFFRIMKAKKAHIKALKIAIGISGQQIKPHTLYYKIWNTYVLSPSS